MSVTSVWVYTGNFHTWWGGGVGLGVGRDFMKGYYFFNLMVPHTSWHHSFCSVYPRTHQYPDLLLSVSVYHVAGAGDAYVTSESIFCKLHPY